MKYRSTFAPKVASYVDFLSYADYYVKTIRSFMKTHLDFLQRIKWRLTKFNLKKIDNG